MILCPTFDTACGISEYTKNLNKFLSQKVLKSVAEIDVNETLIHIQHQPTYFHDDVMNDIVETWDKANIIVTHHEANGPLRWWEHKVTNIVQNEAQQTILKNRGVNSTIIPLGCPQWNYKHKEFNPHQITIGSFGLYSWYKNFAYIAKLFKNSNITFKLWSHTNEFNQKFDNFADFEGNNIIRYKNYLKEEELASQMATECDMLVFWYENISGQVSAAARFGLATGIPTIMRDVTMLQFPEDTNLRCMNLVDAIIELANNAEKRENISKAALKYCKDNNFQKIAGLYKELYGIST